MLHPKSIPKQLGKISFGQAQKLILFGYGKKKKQKEEI
jgi:hypothetical protein